MHNAHQAQLVGAVRRDRVRRGRELAVRALIAAALLIAAVAVVASVDSRAAGQSQLLSWSTSFDDGAGVLGGQQHGVTQIIHTCDADDPACTFQTSSKGFQHGKWVSNLDTERDRKMEVHVRSDLRQGSSYEDDVGEGPLAGIHKTDEKGVFQEWTPRPPRFREREYSRVGVGVPDADGMTSWEQWRQDNPNSRAFGNLPAHATEYPTTAEGVVFRGPISQPVEVSPADQDYDMPYTNVGPLPPKYIYWAPPKYIYRDGVRYVVSPAVSPAVSPEAPSGTGRGSPVWGATYAAKDSQLLDALHKVVAEMRALH